MMLTDEDVERFREIYRNAYGEEMPFEEARMWAIRLVRLYRILLQPTPSEQRTRRLAALPTKPRLILPRYALPSDRQVRSGRLF